MSDGKQIKQIGQNTAEEFFETILYMTAYEESRKIMKDFTKDIDNPILKEAVESAMSVSMFGLVFLGVQYQEKIIERIFNVAEALFGYLIIDPAKRGLNKLRKYKGIKLLKRIPYFNSSRQENIALANVVATHQGFKANGSALTNPTPRSTDTYNSALNTKQSVYQRENLHFQFGNAMASRYNETLLFKLFTKSFTAQDEMLIKKMLGRETGAVLNIEDLNHVADFMFVKDTNGKVTGLSEAFFQLVNTMGYINK
ncbi:hypothetical protein [Sulfurospirillum barnesii]|uniref:Uncharacterized protein n=1 Tax=Sulfurospirillum barnesii (strain ATCC 700032 / DSM 10660 / SES-3) TaxID=760154 RepID=I3Y0N4_SULBS|nr:hypothetical protein [Sulfurospirillum barnesii]AFL69758.1 hypothetical protein Sulba_2491 [Sulfurospirillum barnesii SES-3]